MRSTAGDGCSKRIKTFGEIKDEIRTGWGKKPK
jgi:hypothetical protein